MLRRFCKSVLLFLFSILIVWAVSACDDRPADTASDLIGTSPTEDCRNIVHSMGKTCVPIRSERIIVLDHIMLEAAIALEVKPVGAPLEIVHPALQLAVEGVTDLGEIGAVNLEQVLKLKPDIILGLSSNSPIYSQLSQIAPTVLRKFEHSGEWKDHLAFVGEVLGRSEKVDQIMADYFQNVEEFQKKMNSVTNDPKLEQPNQKQVSVVRIYPNIITLYTNSGFIGTVLEDTDLPRPPSQDLDLEETEALAGDTIQYSISKEVLDKADGDAIFVIVGSWDDKIKDVLADLKADPLWAKLNAVQQGAVHEVGDHWAGSGPIAANAVINDLEKYLTDVP